MSKIAEFDANPTVQDLGDHVIRTGKYFECGDYPDKRFSLSEDEADAVISLLEPIPINLEHVPTVLDGKLGKVTRLWRDGVNILFEAIIPKWLHDITGTKPLKVSAEWDLETKSPLGMGIVLNPRIEDAALMAAFKSGAMQSFHDSAVYKGAECSGKSMFQSVDFLTVDELKAIQHIHDHAAKNGASCDLYASRNAMYSRNAGDSGKEKKGMEITTTWEKVKKSLFGDKEPGDGDTIKLTDDGTGKVDSAVFAAAKAENDALKAEIATMKASAETPNPLAEFGKATFEALKTEAKQLAIAAFGDAQGLVHGVTIDKLEDPAIVKSMRDSFQKVVEVEFGTGMRRQTQPDGSGDPSDADKKVALMAMTDLGKRTLAANGKGGK
jgi:hypothetical protein